MVYGYGMGGYGGIPWGFGGGPSYLSLMAANAVSENTVRVVLSEEPYSDGIGTPWDALDDRRWTVTEVVGTTGIDGKAVRAVRVVQAQLVVGSTESIDVIVDRPFSPWPCQYVVVANGIKGKTSGLLLDPAAVGCTFDGLLRTVENAVKDSAIRGRDIASPQTPSATLDPLPNPATAVLGGFNTNDAGDYAMDEGLTGYKKRIFRRIYCRKRKFVFMPPDWGLGIQDELKKLNTPARREAMRADMQAQVMQEPETADCSVTAWTSPTVPGLVWYRLKAKTKDGRTLDINMPFRPDL